MGKCRILAINPGSTSTKIAIFDDEQKILELTLRHSSEELEPFDTVMEQFSFRKNIILKALGDANIEESTINVVIGRGGLVKPLASGVYEVNDVLRDELLYHPTGEHASNLGGLIADDIARHIGVRAFIADPVVVDELQDVARVSGHPLFPKRTVWHALNQKAMARKYSANVGRPYEELRLIVAHLGGGISVGAHRNGLVVDVNNALDGEGPFSPERSGMLTAKEMARVATSGKYAFGEIMKMIAGKGGVVAHLGTNDMREVRAMAADGNETACLIQRAMCYGVAKEIGAMGAVLEGDVDAIILTGGIAHDPSTCEAISKMVKFIAPVVVYAGEDELEALAANALRVMRGETKAKTYV